MSSAPTLQKPAFDWRSRVSTYLGVLASLWFMLGLLAPLTPDWGAPDTRTLMIFAGVPVCSLTVAAQVAPNTGVRWILRGLGLAMVAFTLLLLWIERPR